VGSGYRPMTSVCGQPHALLAPDKRQGNTADIHAINGFSFASARRLR